MGEYVFTPLFPDTQGKATHLGFTRWPEPTVLLRMQKSEVVVPGGIEPPPTASETIVLSIGLRDPLTLDRHATRRGGSGAQPSSTWQEQGLFLIEKPHVDVPTKDIPLGSSPRASRSIPQE